MANNTVNFTINLDGNAYSGVAQLDKALGKVLINAKKTQSWFGKLQDTVGVSSIKLDAFIGVVDKMAQGFQSLVGSSLDFEQQQANLKTLLNGDAEATDNLIGKIREYGKATVYDRSGLVEAQKTMMAFGINSEFAFGKLKNIGDIALGDSQKMQSLSLAFAQATSSGKLMGQDLMQMINAGFNPLEVISQKTGKSMAQLKDEMSKGQISAGLLAQSFEWATEEGGRFYQGAEMAAQTTAGRIAKMKDTIDEMKVSLFEATGGATAYISEVGQMIVPLAQLAPIFAGIGSAISFCKGHWGGFVKSIRTGVLHVGLNLGIMKYSIASAGGMFKFLQLTAQSACRGISTAIMNIPIIGWIAAIITLVIAGIKLLWEKSEGFRRVVFGVFEAIGAVFHNIWVVVKNVFGFIWERMKNTLDGARQQFHNLYDGVTGVFSAIGDFFSGIWSWISDTVGDSIGWIWEKLSAVGGWIYDNLIAPIRNAFTNLWDIIRGIFDKILGYINKLFEPIKELWNKLFPSDEFEDVAEAYKEGAEKGSESWRKDHTEEPSDISVLGQETGKGTPTLDRPGAELHGGSLGATAGASAGKAQQINITLKSMVGNMTFNGGLRENARDVEAQLRQMMARILGMAETAV